LGTTLLADSDVLFFPDNLTNVAGTLFFRAGSGPGDYELWKSDGTAVGTVRVKDINPGTSNSSSPAYLTNVAGTLFFAPQDRTHGSELWKRGGTAPGRGLVEDVQGGAWWGGTGAGAVRSGSV